MNETIEISDLMLVYTVNIHTGLIVSTRHVKQRYKAPRSSTGALSIDTLATLHTHCSDSRRDVLGDISHLSTLLNTKQITRGEFHTLYYFVRHIQLWNFCYTNTTEISLATGKAHNTIRNILLLLKNKNLISVVSQHFENGNILYAIHPLLAFKGNHTSHNYLCQRYWLSGRLV
jgi:hypothetical protein